MKQTARVVDNIVTWLENAGLGTLMLYAAGMLCTQIIARSAFNHSFFWAEESVRYAIIWMVFIGSAVAFRLDAHISIDALHYWVPKSMRKPLSLSVNAGCLILALLLMVYGFELVGMMFRFNQTSPALEVPMYLVYAVIPGSAVLMTYRLLQSFVRIIHPLPTSVVEPTRPITTG